MAPASSPEAAEGSSFPSSSRALASAAATCFILLPLLMTGEYVWGAGMDLPQQHHPLRELAYESLRNGEWPLWNPYSGSGLPYQTGFRTLAYPVHFLGLFMSTGLAIKCSVLLHAGLGVFFMTSALHFLGFSRLSALTGGVTFGCSGFMLGRVYAGHIDWVEPVAYVPLLLWSFLVAFRRRGVGWTFLCGASVALMGLAGHYQPIYIALVGVLGLLSFLCLTGSRYACPPLDWKGKWRIGVVDRHRESEPWNLTDLSVARKERFTDLFYLGSRVLLAGVLSAGATMFRLLPSAQSALYSNRLAAPETTGDVGLPFSQFLSYIIPHFFEGTSTVLVWGRWPSWETQGYLGVVMLLLIGVSFFGKREAWLAPAALALFAFVVSGGRKLLVYSVWHSVDPLLQNFSAPGRFQLLVLLFGCWLGALGLELLVREKVSLRKVLWAALPVLGLVVAIRIWLSGMESNLLAWGSYVKTMTTPEALQYLLQNHADNLPGLLRTNLDRSWVPLGLVALGSACLASPVAWRPYLLSSLLMLDLFLFAQPYLKTAPPEAFGLEPGLKSYLTSLDPGTRVYWSPELRLRNKLAAHRISDIACSEYFADRAYVRAANIQAGKPIDTPANVVDIEAGQTLPSLQGAEIVLSGRPLNESWLSPVQKLGNVFIYQNKTALPRVFIAGELVEGDVSEVMARAREDLRSFLRDDEVTVNGWSSNRVEIEADLESEGVLVMTDAPWPGWRVKVDGVEESVLPLHGQLHRGVKLSPGKHRVVFFYRPWSLLVGLGISLSTLLLSLLFLGRSRTSERLSDEISEPHTRPTTSEELGVETDE